MGLAITLMACIIIRGITPGVVHRPQQRCPRTVVTPGIIAVTDDDNDNDRSAHS